MKPISDLNDVATNCFPSWRARMNEAALAGDDRLRDIVRHHFLIILAYVVPNIRTAIARHAEHAAMSPAELKLIGGARWVGNFAESAFRSFRVADRLDPAFAALKQLACGELGRDLERARQSILEAIQAVDVVRVRYRAIPRGRERQSFDLSCELGPLCDLLEDRVISCYRIARGQFKLPVIAIYGREVIE